MQELIAQVSVTCNACSVQCLLHTSMHLFTMLHTGQSGADRRFLTGAAILMIFLCSVMLTIEAVQFIERRRGCKYLKELENYFQITLHVLIIVFVAPGFANDCWCAHNWQWQIGALAVFLGWFNLIILLKDIPWTAIPINMFISICITFLKLIYLPLLLLVAFALPFYMIFARTSSALEVGDVYIHILYLSKQHLMISSFNHRRMALENWLHSCLLAIPLQRQWSR